MGSEIWTWNVKMKRCVLFKGQITTESSSAIDRNTTQGKSFSNNCFFAGKVLVEIDFWIGKIARNDFKFS